jgi:hypothetical protein
MKYSGLMLTASLFATLAGCATAAGVEPSSSSSEALTADATTCGPVLFTGEGSGQKRELAYQAAEKDARNECRLTPSFCAVDCEAAPVKDAHCAPLAVQSDDGQITAVTWSCDVTIAASGPPMKKCDVAVRCAPGYHGVDTDGDGCVDSCQPDTCATAIRCAPGYVGVDSDGDGCADLCQPE